MNRLLGIKKRCVAGLAALFVIMITMVSVNASDRKSTRLNSSHRSQSRMPSSA